MTATGSDVFALRNSGLGAFLFADVGAEANGSALTILSVLARLGKDPWAEAANWAALPKSAVIDILAQSIAQMPLVPSALAAARDNAARLVQLLPADKQCLRHVRSSQPRPATPKWLPITVVYLAFGVGMAVHLMLMPRSPSEVRASVDQPTAMPGMTRPGTSLLPNGADYPGHK